MKKTFLFLSFLYSLINVFCQDNNDILYVGTAKINITPKESVYLAGYSGMNSDRITDVIHDSLYCRVTAFKVADKRIVFVSSDIIGFYETCDFIINELGTKFGLKPEDIFLSGTHTHSGPVPTINEKYKNTSNYNYTYELINKLTEAVGKALNEMQSVEIRVNRGYSPIGINRRIIKFNPDEWPFDGGLIKPGRNPKGIVDNEVLVLKITNPKGEFNCCLYDYACHARTQHYGSKIITGDFIGISEQLIENIYGNGMVASAFAGASGEINPYYVSGGFHKEPYWTPETELMGAMLGQEVVRTYRDAKHKVELSKIQSDIVTLKLPGKKDWEYISNDSISTQGFTVTVATIGEIAFIGFGGEPSVKLGLKIKESSPFKYNFIITHCNGGSGYLSPPEYYPERGHEVTYSQYGPEAFDIVVKETLKILYKQRK